MQYKGGNVSNCGVVKGSSTWTRARPAALCRPRRRPATTRGDAQASCRGTSSPTAARSSPPYARRQGPEAHERGDRKAVVKSEAADEVAAATRRGQPGGGGGAVERGRQRRARGEGGTTAIRKVKQLAERVEGRRIDAYNQRARAGPSGRPSGARAADQRHVARSGGAGVGVGQAGDAARRGVAGGLMRDAAHNGEMVPTRRGIPPGTTLYATDEEEAAVALAPKTSASAAWRGRWLRAGDVRSIADGTKLTEEQINQNDLVVKFFPMSMRYAYDADLPYMQETSTGRTSTAATGPCTRA